MHIYIYKQHIKPIYIYIHIYEYISPLWRGPRWCLDVMDQLPMQRSMEWMWPQSIEQYIYIYISAPAQETICTSGVLSCKFSFELAGVLTIFYLWFFCVYMYIYVYIYIYWQKPFGGSFQLLISCSGKFGLTYTVSMPARSTHSTVCRLADITQPTTHILVFNSIICIYIYTYIYIHIYIIYIYIYIYKLLSE